MTGWRSGRCYTERGTNLYYADCRPAFRSRYVSTILPGSLSNTTKTGGEAIVRGGVPGALKIVLSFKTLPSWSKPCSASPIYLERRGRRIAYAARVRPSPNALQTQIADPPIFRFELAERLEGFADRRRS